LPTSACETPGSQARRAAAVVDIHRDGRRGRDGRGLRADFALLVDFAAAAGAGAVNFFLMAAWIVGMSIWLAAWPPMVAYPTIGRPW